MKKLIILVCMVFFTNCNSQEITKAKNIIYIDIGVIFYEGSFTLGAGLNYERMLNDNLSIRAGVNIGFLLTHVIGDKISVSSIGFPVTFNYMTKDKNKFEAGLGGGPWINLSEEKSFSFFPAVKLGYRYQPDEAGFMFKAGVELPANLYISLLSAGYHFK